MKESISHIPEKKQQELEKVIELIKETTHKNIGAEMIILFGSYARGDFVVKDVVTEGGGTRVYESDFDIMVITKKPTQEKNFRLSKEINEKIEKDTEIKSHFNIIIEDIHHVNKMLEESRYFYIDIKNEGICLYNSGKYKLEGPKELDSRRKKEIQQEDFELWFGDGTSFFKHYSIAFDDADYRIGAFLLHQATERYITALLLVKTSYKPKTHDLEILYNKIIEIDSSFQDVFDLSNEKEHHHFELLRKAYIEARYSKTYAITQEELAFIEQKIKDMSQKVQQFCKAEIEK